MAKPTISNFNKRLGTLRTERSTFLSHWRELSDFYLAHRGRFLTSDRNKGHKRNTSQINNHGRLAARTLASGMMAGITSPARPWFRLSASDPGLKEVAAVKQWLHEVQVIMYRVFSASNTYNSLHALYAELGVFGTAAMGVFKDFDNVIWCKPYTIGSYMIFTNNKGLVEGFYREYEITVAQAIEQFRKEKCSLDVQSRFKNGDTESWVPIVHAVEPNDDRDHMSPMARDMKFRSVYYEKSEGGKGENDKFLRRSGFPDFPIMAPRWDVIGEDVYATDCPGMTALGDNKALQLGERRMYQGLDVIAAPPLQAPVSLRSLMRGGRVQSGDIIWTPGDSAGIKTIYNYQPDVDKMLNVNDRTEARISRAFYEDLFLMLANTDRRQITAREIAEKHEEKLLMLGPVLERLHAELLDPLIDRTFNILQQAGVLPDPPPELQNRDLSVEYVSVLAQAQRMVATGAVERLAAFTGELVAVWPGARHKFKATQAVDEYAEALGTPPDLIRSDDEVEAIQAAEAQAAERQVAMEQSAQLADMAKTASETQVEEGNAFGNIMKQAGQL